MKRLAFLLAGIFSMAFMAVLFSSCEEDPDPPVAEIFYEIGEDGFTVAFTAQTENVTAYAWDFGDGSTSTEAAPSHTYPSSGDYTVTLTATGDGGSTDATKSITIASTFEEMLTGGPGAANGKTWVLSTTATLPTDGVSKIDPNFAPQYIPLPDNALSLYDLAAEYDNEYTFYWDGTYGVKGINGAVLTGLIYTYTALSGDASIIVPPNTAGAGLCGAEFSDVSNATWAYQKGDLVLTVANENYPDGTTEGEENITFEDVDYLTFDNGGHLGIKDYTTTVIVRSMSSDRMQVTFFLSSLYPDVNPTVFTLPSLCITATLEPK